MRQKGHLGTASWGGLAADLVGSLKGRRPFRCRARHGGMRHQLMGRGCLEDWSFTLWPLSLWEQGADGGMRSRHAYDERIMRRNSPFVAPKCSRRNE